MYLLFQEANSLSSANLASDFTVSLQVISSLDSSSTDILMPKARVGEIKKSKLSLVMLKISGGGVDNHCTADLLFDWLGFSCFACVELERDLQVWSNPNQSNRWAVQ